MDKVTIYKNKGETFECQFRIDGASIEDTAIRLCLEFSNNKNMFFYGTLKHDGNCSIDIPILKELSSQQGKMVIEAIADSTYFKLYEADVEVKNSVEVAVVKKPNIVETKKTSIKLEQITPTKKPTKPHITVETPLESPIIEKSPEEEGWEPAQVERKIYQPMTSASETSEPSRLRRFDDFLKKKQ